MASSKVIPTKYMTELKTQLMKERGIAESSANTYIANLVLLNEKNSFNNLGFLKKNKDLILEHLTQYADSTEQNYLTAIVSCLSTRKDDHLYKTIYKTYKEILNEKLGKRDEIDSSIKTDTQKENWINWEDVMKRWQELHDEVNIFKNDKSITRKNFEILLDYLVLSLYVLTPPRRNKDYLCMYILLKKDDKPLEPEIKNYLDVEDEQMIFNHYKTAKHYGIQVEKIPEKLMDVIKIWIKFHPNLHGVTRKPREVKLFTNIEGTGITLINFITLRLNRIFDKKVSSSLLRHSFLTSKFGDEYNEITKLEKIIKEKGSDVIAKAMAHSTREQKMYSKAD
jgi:hypothetical protein